MQMGDEKMMNKEEEEMLKLMQLPCGLILPMVFKSAVELGLFEIMAKAGPNAQLSATEIASHLPTQNPQAPVLVDRMMRFLSNSSLLTCTVLVTDEYHDGSSGAYNNMIRLYSLAPICKNFLSSDHDEDDNNYSLAALLLLPLDRVLLEPWYHLKDAIIEGRTPFERAHDGMDAFEYQARDSRFNEAFNKGMHSHTRIVMKRLLQVYDGFEGVKQVVDVGGGLGATLACLISKYPNIRAINFDLPHVIQNAPLHPGVEHVSGDMFEGVPKAEVILMKWILHDWGDDHCLKLLRNCLEALPEKGKVIVVETVLPECPEAGDDLLSKSGFQSDMYMMIMNPGGKERTHEEFEALAKGAGFASIKLICHCFSYWVIEFYKN